MNNKRTNLIVLIIIAISLILSILSIREDSFIVDEIPHIAAGYSYLVKGDMRLNPEHPPLAKDLAAIPLIFANLNKDVFSTKFWQEDLNGQWEFGRRLIFNSGNNAEQIKYLVRIPMLLFFVLSSLLIFKWGQKLYGNLGSIIALLLFSFSSTVLAHSRFVTTDVPALFGVLLATYFFVSYLRSSTKKSLFIASLAFGIALLLKFSTFLLVPFFLILALIYGFVKNPRPADGSAPWLGHKIKDAAKTLVPTIIIFIIGFVIIVWPVYHLHTRNYPPQRQRNDTVQLLSSYGNRTFAEPVIWASDKPTLRAAAQYGLGLLLVNQRAVGGNTAFFLGEVSRFGWHSYFPIVYFLKEPFSWWALLLIALVSAALRWRYAVKEWANRGYNFVRNNLEEFSMILWLVIYWGLSVNSTLNIGVRHLLPTYPFAILLVSGVISKIAKSYQTKFYHKKLVAFYLLIFTLISWYIYENIKTFPYYLTYFNQAAGGPSGGYKYVVDSNLDWGQDLVRLRNFVKENNIPRIEFDYFGWADPYYYLKNSYIWSNSTKYLDAKDFKTRNQSDGWLAVSVTFLQGSEGAYDQPNPINYNWLKAYNPTVVIGNSIFIYRIK